VPLAWPAPYHWCIRSSAWVEYGLFAHHALAAYFLYVVVGVGDDPVAADELCGVVTEIADRDGVRKYKTVAGFVRLLGR